MDSQSRLDALETALAAWLAAQRKGAPRTELLEAEARLRELARCR